MTNYLLTKPVFDKKIVYQIYTPSFYDSNNDGIGDLQGIITKLPYLKKLGIDIIWISPFFVSPKNDNGYDVADYYNVDPLMGTMQDLEQLIQKAKSYNIVIMADMVLNHTSTQHEWFQKALKGEQKYQDFYFFKDNKKPYNNWKSKFGGSAWKYVPTLKKQYLHLFDQTQADLNWQNPDVQKEIYKIVNFWLNKGIEALRFDVINLISKPNEMENDFLGDGRRFYTDHYKIHDLLKNLNKNTFGKNQKILTVGEMSSTSIDHCIQYANAQKTELNMIFSFHHLKVDYLNNQKWVLKKWNKKEFVNLIKLWQLEMQKSNSTLALFLNNHDQPRINSRFGDDQKYWYESSTLFTSLNFFLRGVPYIYQGEEIGMTNAHFKSLKDFVDVESINIIKKLLKQKVDKKEILNILNNRSRDNSRTPFQWDDSKYAGFSQTKPWIKINKNKNQINLAKEVNDPNSVFNYYQRIIKFWKSNKTIQNGLIKFEQAPSSCLIFWRYDQNKKYLCCFNLSMKNQKIQHNLNDCNLVFGNYFKNKKTKQLKPLELKIFEFNK